MIHNSNRGSHSAFPYCHNVKKKRKLKICVDFQKFNVAIKRINILYPSLRRFWRWWIIMKIIPYWIDFFIITKSNSPRRQEQNNFHHRFGNFV